MPDIGLVLGEEGGGEEEEEGKGEEEAGRPGDKGTRRLGEAGELGVPPGTTVW